MCDVMDVCKYTINWFLDKPLAITNLKLQKVLYFIQANFLVELNKPCFEDDFVAWELGPVVKDAYEKYRICSSTPIIFREKPKRDFTRKELKYINDILEQLKFTSAYDLVNLTHEKGGPWDLVYNAGYKGAGLGDVIPKESIRNFYMKWKSK